MARVLIDMLPGDDLDATRGEAARVGDTRMTAFHDAGQRLGRTVARTLGWQHHVAWDIYLVYRPAASWGAGELPAPDTWFHQLNDREAWEEAAGEEFESSEWTGALAERSEADPALFRTGDDLRMALIEAIRGAADPTGG